VSVFLIEWYITQGLVFLALAVKGFALVHSVIQPAAAYQAADKLSKPAWVAILALGVLAQVVLIQATPINLLSLVFTIAALVYLADVKPAIAELST
jgi:Protein of unknown function (DUF2516)